MKQASVPRRSAGLVVVLATVTIGVLASAVPAFAAPGGLDPSFGHGGKVKTSFTTSDDSAYGLAIQADGKIVAAGLTDGKRFAIARYLSNGSLDTSFGGGDGLVTVNSLGVVGAAVAYAVAVQGDGKIVAVGQGDPGAVVVRLDSNGSLDTTFGNGGIAVAPFFNNGDAGAQDVVIQADGKIVIAGYDKNGSQKELFAIARFTRTGELDPSFSSNGMQSIAFGAQDSYANAVLIQPSDQKIVVIGAAGSPSNGEDFALLRLNTNGTLDTTFSGNGAAEFTDGKGAFGVDGAIATAGRIVVAGTGVGQGEDFGLIEVGPDGTLVGSFGTGGKVLTDFAGDNDFASRVSLQSDGRIVLVGSSWQGKKHQFDFGLARYKSNGALDKSFGKGGLVTTSFGDWESGDDVAIQSDGRIVMAGFSGTKSARFALARYLA